ncbi:hypothetical protein BC826DRAFT_110752 [Russula brevipes]|nr:hypothetical protein BC826DRAFT_110752 [Russula brevipes]
MGLGASLVPLWLTQDAWELAQTELAVLMGARAQNMHSTSRRPVAPSPPPFAITMSGTANFQADPELGLGGSVVIAGLEGSAQAQHEASGRVDSPLGNDVDPNIPPEESHEECNDFDDGANALYEKEVRPRDEAQIQTLKLKG